MSDFGVSVPLINNLPLANLGFNWVVPVAIASIIGYFVKSNNTNSNVKEKIA